MSKGNIKHFKKDQGYELIPRELLQSCDTNSKHCKNISLQAIGLLCNLQSYPENWDLNKSELYKRYSKNKRDSVKKAWDELIKANFIIQFKKREKSKYNYVYYFSLTPFSDEDIKEIEKFENVKADLDFKLKKNKQKNNSKKEVKNKKSKLKKHTKVLKYQGEMEVRFSTVENRQSEIDSRKPTLKRLHSKDITHQDITQEDISEMNGMSANNISKTITYNHSAHSNHQNDNYLIDEQTHLLKPMPEELKQFIKSRYTLADSISIINKIMQAKKAAGDRRNDVPFFYFEQNEELSDKIIEILIAVNREMKKKQESVQSMLAYYYNALVNGLEEFHFTMQAREAVRDKNSFLDI
ncbi:nuclease [Mammaliicoccus fleurettii]|uniref:nuclease n=1 Tax=Mammaliicoccus fleurettii TaxID=150056 RepID=UPI000E071349|nr:nuclease [Mammaliicoccus fleurettii]RTX91876.1 nuclease [Mammaliicoccus fleurettii]SUN01430.1 Uncharacterised protein [Mammaliicoccus fleurettii]SUN01455.1 Uncharacterised protein [Mammaliicoccus fleurettii]